MPRPFSKVRSAAIDGRLHNPIYAKTQLKQLHDTLSQNVTEIQKAITRDTGHRASEVKVEFWLAMRCLADAYSALSPDKLLEEEYGLAKGKDSPHAREPVGVVVIEPTLHTFFYSVVSAVAPAIAAGNCVIVQLDQSLLEAPLLILKLTDEALDHDVFEVCTTKVKPADLAHRHLRVSQNGAPDSSANNLVSRPNSLVAAIVDRDADIQAAARALVLSRFGLRGASPYAPDIVFVSEWVKKEFLAAVSRESIAFLEDSVASRKGAVEGLLEEVSKEGLATVVHAGRGAVVLDVENRESFLLGRKVKECCLAVHAVTSMDDAIDMTKRLGRLSAAYVFATPGMAKYICQFADAEASFVNHIPPTLLFGPVNPTAKPLDLGLGRYHAAQFTLPNPQYIAPPTSFDRISKVLLGASPRDLKALGDEASARLPDMKRPSKVHGIGFFEKGIVTGGVVLLATVISCAGGVVYCVSRQGWPLVWPRPNLF